MATGRRPNQGWAAKTAHMKGRVATQWPPTPSRGKLQKVCKDLIFNYFGPFYNCLTSKLGGTVAYAHLIDRSTP